MSKRLLCAVSLLCLAQALAWADAVSLSDKAVRVRIVENEQELQFTSSSDIALTVNGDSETLPAGAYRVALQRATPATLRYHVFAKTFLPGEDAEQEAFIALARKKNLPVRVIEQGLVLETGTRKKIDTRMRLISVGFFADRAEAEALKTSLAEEEMWSWIQHEVISAGYGTAVLRNDSSGDWREVPLPFTMTAAGSLSFDDVDTGFWSENRKHQHYAGAVEFAVGLDGGIDIIESIGLEDYLRGVLPAEMPTEWPEDALKAQAVAARSEVLSNLAKKHLLEGFDFCGVEHCRAYLGSADADARVAKALADTRGEFLVHGDQIVPTVFSATCGGWTENNETVWSGRAQPALRGVADVPKQRGARPPAETGLVNWVHHPPAAYCSADETYFRWTRAFTVAELTAIVNRRHAVGTVQRIEAGERGISGRLKWVRIVGSAKSENVYKELPIRQAFGGLPSALFLVDPAPKNGRFVFYGAGRGHGVGLCQHGARAMAEKDIGYKKILTHYFTGTAIEQFR